MRENSNQGNGKILATSAMMCRVANIVLLSFLVGAKAAIDGLAMTPPMGWRNWNFFQGNITQDIMIRNMEARVNARVYGKNILYLY